MTAAKGHVMDKDKVPVLNISITHTVFFPESSFSDNIYFIFDPVDDKLYVDRGTAINFHNEIRITRLYIDYFISIYHFCQEHGNGKVIELKEKCFYEILEQKPFFHHYGIKKIQGQIIERTESTKKISGFIHTRQTET